MEYNGVWVFNGVKSAFPSGVFSKREDAIRWITEKKLSGTLTKYPVDIPVYDWAIKNGLFKPKKGEQEQAEFIGRFSCANMEHFHFENGNAD